jgi:hypothetical protein
MRYAGVGRFVCLWSLRLNRDRQNGGPPGLSERRVQDGLHAPVSGGDRVAEVRQETVGRHEQGAPARSGRLPR